MSDEQLADARQQVTPALIEVLEYDEAEVRVAAVKAIGYFSSASDDVVRALTDVLDDLSDRVRMAAVNVLGECGAAAKTAVPALTELMEDEAAEVQTAAAIALWQIEGNQSAIEKLRQMLATGAIAHLYNLYNALRDAGPSGMVFESALLDALEREHNLEERQWLAAALISIHPSSQPAISALIRLLNVDDEDELVDLSSAVHELGRVGRGHPEIIGALRDVVEDYRRDDWTRLTAADGLWMCGEYDTAATTLIQFLTSCKSDRRCCASTVVEFWARCILEHGVSFADVLLPKLIDAFHQPQTTQVRMQLIRAMKRVGVAAIPVIREALGDADLSVQAVAKEAIDFIEFKAD